MSTKSRARTRKYKAQTDKILDMMINSVYSQREVFLRELISNASDAIDKAKYLSLTDDSIKIGEEGLRIKLFLDPEANTFAIWDNGIGMSEDEVIENLGTIARSGSEAFRDEAGEEPVSNDLIGRFGVGFYSVFMVADKVSVVTQKAGEDHAVQWTSTGGENYLIQKLPPRERGTRVTLELKTAHPAIDLPAGAGEDDDGPDMEAASDNRPPAEAFTDIWTIKRVVKKHSDFIAYPILIDVDKQETPSDDEGNPIEGAEPKRWVEEETLNSMRPLWTRRPKDIEESEYKEFYRHITHDWKDPFSTIHFHVEGMREYSGLMYMPSEAPPDLYTREHRRGLQLYARRVFIMEECRELMPEYLRFVRGLVDSPDLPLNVSRETIQHDRLIATIRKQLIRRVLADLKNKLHEDRTSYEAFWANFGPVLKEGFHYDPNQAKRLVDLVLYRSTQGEGWTDLAGYIERMPEGQDTIYYLSGESMELLRHSPQLEAFAKQGVEVLLMDDAVDDLVMAQIREHEGHPVKSAAHGEVDLDSIVTDKSTEASENDAEDQSDESDSQSSEAPDAAAIAPLIESLQSHLGEHIESVRISKRLTESAVCLVAKEEGLSPHMQQMMRAMGHDMPEEKRILEINADHALVRGMLEMVEADKKDPRLSDYAEMLLDQALLSEGSPLKNPARFAQRVASVMAKAAQPNGKDA